MMRYLFLVFFTFALNSFLQGQVDEIWLEPVSEEEKESPKEVLTDSVEIVKLIRQQENAGEGIPAGGLIRSVFRETIDSVLIEFAVNGEDHGSVLSDKGVFLLPSFQKGQLIDVSLSHPDFHAIDTALVIDDQEIVFLSLMMVPKYKILLRGRVYAGNVPLEGAQVIVNFEGKSSELFTRPCYYDEEDYWNCLFHGMFKIELTAENPNDSLSFLITSRGMEPLEYTMAFKDYEGEIMDIQMRYKSELPEVPLNAIGLNLSFPFLSTNDDWFIDASYYRLLNSTNLRRLAWGLDLNMFVSNITVEHETLNGLETASYDSSYISVFLGPSARFYIIPPEKRRFSTYVGTTLAWQVGKSAIIPEPFIGTRVFLDLNKSLTLELRYANFEENIYHYKFNYYGNADPYTVTTTLEKLNLNFGVEVVF